MAMLFEHNGDWPDTDEELRELNEEDPCYFCDRTTNCICDSVYDFAEETELMEELEHE